MHDIGKVSPGFEGKYFRSLLQSCAPEWFLELVNHGVTTNHSQVGAKALQTLLGISIEHPVFQAVASHHGFKPDSFLVTKDGCWQQERTKLISALAMEFETTPDSVVKTKPDSSLLAGITCVSDWIASDESFFPSDEPPLSTVEGRARAAHALTVCGFARPSFVHGLTFSNIFGFEPYPAQQAFIDTITDSGIYVLEAPMGVGKTEAALYAAYRLIEQGKHSGIYFALPTRLTSDRIHERVRTFLNNVSTTPSAVKLAHGQAWLKEFEFGAEGSDKKAGYRAGPWFAPSKRGLLFPFTVGTIDQALLAVLNVKHSFVRSYGLAGKVVILDEVHSYDTYTGTLLDELIARLRGLGCTVIILSATLTTARRKALIGMDAPMDDGYPLLSGIRGIEEKPIVRKLDSPQSRMVQLRWINGVNESPVSMAIEKAQTGCNVLCIANTVSTAQEWFRILKSELRAGDDFPIGLLHSKFTESDREKLENTWMGWLGKSQKQGVSQRPCGSILVSTQIVEQSVDIDADWMVSELAPADMLLQRLGRLWRHERTTRPISEAELAIVCPQMPNDDLSNLSPDIKDMEAFFGRGCWVYAPYVLLRTFETLRYKRTIHIPNEIRSLLETVYSDSVPNSALHFFLYAEMKKKYEQLRQLALMGQADSLPTQSDDNETTVRTRYSSRPSVSLLIVNSLERTPKGHIATLLDGQSVVFSPFVRDLTIVRKLYKNLVHVAPNEAILASTPDSDLLEQYFFVSEMPRICVRDASSGELVLYHSGLSAGYAYLPSFGAFRISSMDDGIISTKQHTFSDPIPDDDFIFDNGKDW